MALGRRIGFGAVWPFLDRAGRAAYKFRTREIEGICASQGVVLSDPKSGRTWVEVILSKLFVVRLGLADDRILEFERDSVIVPGVPHLHFTHDFAHVIRGEWQLPVRCTRGYMHNKLVLLIVRNPIDTAVSMYFQQIKREHNLSDVEIFNYVRDWKGGLPTIIEFLNFWSGELLRIDRYLMVSYEELRADTIIHVNRIVRFFGFEFSNAEIAAAVAFADFDNLQQMEKKGQLSDWRFSKSAVDDEDRLKVRRGKVGGYRDYFDADQCAELEKIVADTLDPIYGYGDGEKPP